MINTDHVLLELRLTGGLTMTQLTDRLTGRDADKRIDVRQSLSYLVRNGQVHRDTTVRPTFFTAVTP